MEQHSNRNQRDTLQKTEGREQVELDPLTPVFPDAFHLRSVLASWERIAIEQMLVKTDGAKAEAARRLGLSKSDLTYKLAKFATPKIQKE